MPKLLDLSGIDFDAVIDYYKLHSKNACLEKFNLTSRGFDLILKNKNYKKSHEDAVATRINSFKEKYGVENPWQIEAVKLKCNTPEIIAKAAVTRRENCNKKYGVDYYFQVEECKNKASQTKLERYGDKNYNNPEKNKQTCLERYGVEHASQTDMVQEKIKATCLIKYNAPSALLNSNVQQKIIQTNLERYGVENPFQVEEFKEKSKKTCLDKYGVEFYTQTEEYAKNAAKKYKFNDIFFDSSWELALWIYAKDHNEEIQYHPTTIKYYFNDTEHTYTPDFLYNKQLIEIKGDYMLNEDKTLYDFYNEDQSKAIAKQKCIEENNIIIWNSNDIKFALDYIDTTYGKNYLTNFKINKK